MMAVVETKSLTKDFGDGLGCHDISLTVKQGEIFGLLGPNGAGKSTLVKTLVGLLQKTSGVAHILGLPAGSLEARRKIGYLPELFRYQDWLTAREVLRLHARLSQVPTHGREARMASVLAQVGLSRRADERVRHFSKGMQQKLGLACALVSDPPVLFLDEPVSALDPGARHDVRQLLLRLRDEGKTVFLNTHLLEDVEVICNSVAFLADGRIHANGSVKDILRPMISWDVLVGGWLVDSLAEIKAASGLALEVVTVAEDGTARLRLSAGHRDEVGWLNHNLDRLGYFIYEVCPVHNRLESWFLEQSERMREPSNLDEVREE